MKLLEKIVSSFLVILLLGLFLFEIGAGLAISHIETVHACQACGDSGAVEK